MLQMWRETAQPVNPTSMSERNPNNPRHVFKCGVVHMVPISIFAKELIYAYKTFTATALYKPQGSVLSGGAFTALGFPEHP